MDDNLEKLKEENKALINLNKSLKVDRNVAVEEQEKYYKLKQGIEELFTKYPDEHLWDVNVFEIRDKLQQLLGEQT